MLKVNSLSGFGGVTSGVVLDADAQAFIDAAVITDETQKNAINQLVLAFKTAGIWTKMTAIYPFVGGTATTHKYNLKDPQDTDGAFRIVWNGTVTHDSDGITGDGSTGYGDTKLIPSVDLTEDDTHLSVYSRTAETGNPYDFGSTQSSNRFRIAARLSNLFIASCYASGTQLTPANTTAGMFLLSRRSNTDFECYKDGSSAASTATADSASRPTTYALYLLALHLDGSASSFSTNNLAFASVGTSLDDTEASDFFDAVDTFQTSLSRNV